MDRYDLVVVGAGAAGLSAARFAARLGARAALVERGRTGGDCTWTGCVPSKALLEAARVADEMRRADAFGLGRAEPRVDLGQVMARVRDAIDRVYQFETPEALAEEGIDVISGIARFLDPQRLDVGGRVVLGKRFVICTGASPFIPPIPGLAEVLYLTHETIFGLRELPERLLVLGGGSIGVELGQAFRRLGSEVAVYEECDRLLPAADPDASVELARQFEREGIRLVLGMGVDRVETKGGGIAATAGGVTCVGDRLLVAVGRRPKTAGLGLDRAGVEHDAGGIHVDAQLRTSQRHIYAAGDVTGSFQFTHYAGWQGFVAARNALLPGKGRGTRAEVPWVVFSDPAIGQVGVGEREARERGERIEVHRWPVERIDRAQTASAQTGFLKLVVRSNGTLLGATVVSRGAPELINELALAVDRRLTLSDFATTIHAYPTYGFGLQQASADAALVRLSRGWRGRLLSALVQR